MQTDDTSIVKEGDWKDSMIRLTHLNAKEFLVNCDLIQYVEITPDTLVIMTSGDRIMVKESPGELLERVVAFKRRVMEGMAEIPVRRAGSLQAAEPPGVK